MEIGRVTKRPKRVQYTKEAVSVTEQEIVVAEDVEVDLDPRPDRGIRDEYQALPTERSLKLDARIDRNCDQLRTLIKRFTAKGNEWSLDDFRMAFGSVERRQLTAFMEKSGPEAGKQLKVYPLAWDFVNLREQIGLPLLSWKPPLDRSSPPHTADPSVPELRDRTIDEFFCEEQLDTVTILAILTHPKGINNLRKDANDGPLRYHSHQ